MLGDRTSKLDVVGHRYSLREVVDDWIFDLDLGYKN
jgi:hypothetical protein